MKTYSAEIRRVSAPCGEIEYTLERKTVKNINLRVKRDGTVYVSAPKRVSIAEIERFIIANSSSVTDAADFFRKRSENAPPAFTCSDGETVRIVGAEMKIRVVKSDRDLVNFGGNVIFIYTKTPDSEEHRKKLYSAWLEKKSRAIFLEIMKAVHKDFVPLGVSFPELRIRTMTSRWGSCHPYKGIITLNRRLIEAPSGCIEHVITHEFCHFIHPNHSKDFYALLSSLQPDWKKRKALLESIVKI